MYKRQFLFCSGLIGSGLIPGGKFFLHYILIAVSVYFLGIVFCRYYMYSCILRLGQLFCVQKNYILSDNLCEPGAQAIDAYSLFLYMQEKNLPVKYVLLKQNSLYQKLKSENKLKDVIVVNRSIVKNSLGYILAILPYIFTCKAVLTSSPSGQFDYVYRTNSKLKYIFLQHGMTMLKQGVLDWYNPDIFDKMLISGDAEFDVVKKAGFDDNSVIKSGLCRWDFLRKEHSAQKQILVMFTWRQTFNDKDYNIPLNDTEYVKKLKSFLNNIELQEFLKENKIKLVCSIHHYILDICKDSIDLGENIELADSNNLDWYIKTSDLLVTDYSSIAFDFLFLNTPVIFYRLDFEDSTLDEFDKFNANSAKSMDNYLFNTFYDEGSAVQKIRYYVQNGFVLEDDYKQIAEKLYYTKTNIRECIVNDLEKSV